MDRVEKDLSEIKAAQEKLLQIFQEQKDAQFAFIKQASEETPRLRKRVSRKIEAHKAEVDQKLKEHKETCPVAVAEKKQAESPSWSWPSIAKGLFAVGMGGAMIVSGFLYGLGAWSGKEPGKETVKTASVASITATVSHE